MRKLLQVLFQPYPADLSWKVTFRDANLSFLFVTLFLFFFKPFGTKIPDDYQATFFLICICFGLVTWSVCMLFYSFRYLSPTFFKEENWRVWKEIIDTLLLVATIATANMLFSNYYFEQVSLWQNFWGWQKTTFSIGIFPTLFTAFYKQNKLANRYTNESQVINKNLDERSQHQTEEGISKIQPIENQIITFSGENQNEKLEIEKDALCYISSADNYVQISYLENNALKQVLLRSSLKKIEETLLAFPEFYRCHRAYIVNLQKVKHISGNAQGYKLHLESTDLPIPVSRSLNEEIATKFAKK